MSIQKITSISSRKTRTNPLQPKNSNVSSIKNGKYGATLEKSEAVKNSYMDGISFKGYPKYVDCKFYRTGGDITEEDIYKEAVRYLPYPITENQVVKKGYTHVYPKSSTGTSNRVSFFILSSGETLTDKLLNDFDYIVLDREDADKPVVHVEGEEVPKKMVYKGYDLPYDVDSDRIEEASDSKTLGDIVSKLKERQDAIRFELNTAKSRKEYVSRKTEYSNDSYQKALKKLNNTDPNDAEALAKAQSDVDKEYKYYIYNYDEGEYVAQKIETLKELQVQNAEKLSNAKSKFELVQKVEDRCAEEHRAKNQKPKSLFQRIFRI